MNGFVSQIVRKTVDRIFLTRGRKAAQRADREKEVERKALNIHLLHVNKMVTK